MRVYQWIPDTGIVSAPSYFLVLGFLSYFYRTYTLDLSFNRLSYYRGVWLVWLGGIYLYTSRTWTMRSKDPSNVPTRLHHPKYLYLLQPSPYFPQAASHKQWLEAKTRVS